jgi:hypothetical protein
MTDLFQADNNATPLTEAERADLIPTYISLRSELNELEQKNVAEAYVWAFRLNTAWFQCIPSPTGMAVGHGWQGTC